MGLAVSILKSAAGFPASVTCQPNDRMGRRRARGSPAHQRRYLANPPVKRQRIRFSDQYGNLGGWHQHGLLRHQREMVAMICFERKTCRASFGYTRGSALHPVLRRQKHSSTTPPIPGFRLPQPACRGFIPPWRTRTNVKRWDYDGDRREDFALFLCYDDPEPSVPDYCAWVSFYGAGTPTTPAVQIGDQITADGLTLTPMPADFNGDGMTDLIYAYGGAWRSRAGGGGLYSEIQGALTAGHTGFPVITDYDSDGKTDLVVRSTSSGTWEIVRGNGIALSPSTITGPSAANGLSPFIGDFNGDGLSDLAWTNSATNTLTWVASRWSISRSITECDGRLWRRRHL